MRREWFKSVDMFADTEVLYFDCHSTTPLDPIVLEAMLPFLTVDFGNAGSHSHAFGWRAAEAAERARAEFAEAVGAGSDEIVFTGSATEANNLAIAGVAERWRGKRQHLITSEIEHPSVLEPMRRLERQGWRLTVLPVVRHDDPRVLAGDAEVAVGTVELAALEQALDQETCLVSISVANNEVGVLQPVKLLADAAHRVGAWFHTDASQAVGWVPIRVAEWSVDLVSFSAHKFYGPKGVGCLYVRGEATYEGARPVRVLPQVVGGGQERGLRSGTQNVAHMVGMARAAAMAVAATDSQAVQTAERRDRLWHLLVAACPRLQLNGPPLNRRDWRLPNNLNFAVPGIEGQTIMLQTPGVACSSGSACSSAQPGVSRVLRALGLSEETARSSLRIGLGRFHTDEMIELAVERLVAGVRRCESGT